MPRQTRAQRIDEERMTGCRNGREIPIEHVRGGVVVGTSSLPFPTFTSSAPREAHQRATDRPNRRVSRRVIRMLDNDVVVTGQNIKPLRMLFGCHRDYRISRDHRWQLWQTGLNRFAVLEFVRNGNRWETSRRAQIVNERADTYPWRAYWSTGGQTLHHTIRDAFELVAGVNQ